MAGVQPVPRDPTDRDRLREEWRLKALEWSNADDNAARLTEGKSLLLDEMVLRLIDDNGMSATKAEKVARTSQHFKEYLRKMHDAKRAAQDLKIEAENLNRIYWEQVSHEATERTERRMSR